MLLRVSRTVNVFNRDVPYDRAEKLRERGKGNHRSQQGDLLAILEEVLRPGLLTFFEASEKIRAMNFYTPDESTQMIREGRVSR